MKRILAIMGSPRKNMNSDFALDYVIKHLPQDFSIEKIYVSDLKILDCTGSNCCVSTNMCIHDDDMDSLIKKFNEADGIILSSPVYFNSFPSLLKRMIDRCQLIWVSKYINENSLINRSKKRFGMLISTAGAPPYEDQFIGNNLVGKHFFRSINAAFDHEINFYDTDKRPVSTQTEALEYLKSEALKLAESVASIQ